MINNARVIEISSVNDSLVSVKTFNVDNNIIKTIGNMGRFNMRKYLKNKKIEEFIFLLHNKSFGECK